MLTSAEKYQYISEMYAACYLNVSSFYADEIGVELAYVTQAILSETKCELEFQSSLTKLLRVEFPANHRIWYFIYFEPSVMCSLCGHDVLIADATFSTILNGWFGKMCCSIHPKECIRCGLISDECHCTNGPYNIVDGQMYNRMDRQKIIFTQK